VASKARATRSIWPAKAAFVVVAACRNYSGAVVSRRRASSRIRRGWASRPNGMPTTCPSSTHIMLASGCVERLMHRTRPIQERHPRSVASQRLAARAARARRAPFQSRLQPPTFPGGWPDGGRIGRARGPCDWPAMGDDGAGARLGVAEPRRAAARISRVKAPRGAALPARSGEAAGNCCSIATRLTDNIHTGESACECALG
jgi:hypothetical protein